MEENADIKEEKAAAKPSWVKMKRADVENLIIELAKKGNSPAKIGLLLRDLHGVPKAKVFDLKIADFLRKKGINYEDEKKIVDEKIGMLKMHIEKNKHDHTATRALTKQLWVLHGVNTRQNS